MPDIIAQCSQMLVEKSGGGGGRQINAPLLSVFLGEDAEAHREDVFFTYKSCWLNGAESLKSLTARDYSPDSVLTTVQTMLAANFRTYSTVYLAYYWDIMDSRFDEFFQAVQQDLSFPVAITAETFFFVFCREFTPIEREQKKTRLQTLIAWAKETGRHLIVLSTFTLVGLRDAGENYRLAANLLLISNTWFSPGEKNLGSNLTFFLSRQPVYSAGYYVLKKNTWDIAATCLWQILDNYQHFSAERFGAAGVREQLCGADSDYHALFQQIFCEKIAPLLPQDASFLRYLPYTKEIASLDSNLSDIGPRGFFGSRNVHPFVNRNTAAEAIQSIRPIWEACLDLYYRCPTTAWMNSPEGSAFIMEFFCKKLNYALDFKSMRDLLPDEARYLKELSSNADWTPPQPSESLPMELSDWLHHRARWELQTDVFRKLAQKLAEAMEQMRSDADGFEDVLAKAKGGLGIENVDPSVRKAYGAKTSALLTSDRDLLAGKISPCRDGGELLEQAGGVFEQLVGKDRVYSLSLQEHFNFLIENAAVGVDRIINTYFLQDMYQTGRLQTYTLPDSESGHMYCMVSQGAFTEYIQPRLHGDVFIVPRTDCIERLLVYPIAPDDIIY